MAVIHTKDSEIRPQDLTLDFYLEATPIGGGKPINMTGLDSYRIGPFQSNLGFGITSIDIDIKPNLQPVVSITFKDLYGNLIFNDQESEFNYKVLFQLPYPKFRLYVKGYLGKPVSFLLQVKSVKTTFVPTDGSYEIKAEFVPNVFGFLNDIPYQFLFAVKELKKINGDTTNGSDSSIIEIAKVGFDINIQIQQATDKYGPLISQLQTFSGNYNAIGTAFRDGTLKLDPILGDSDLIGKNFKSISFNINTKNPKGELLNKIADNQLEVYGKSIFLSINSTTQINLNDDFKKLSASTTIDSVQIQEANVKKILNENLKIVQDLSKTQAYSSVENKVLDTQSIGNVMTRLAGDCAYILGYILEGGLAGFNSDSSRLTNNEIFGNYYPLFENKNPNAEATTLGEQIPWNGADTQEIAKVKEFVKAFYIGNQEANKVIDEVQAKKEGTESADPTQGATPGTFSKKIGNAETFRDNSPYFATADSIIVNLIQRAGLLGSGFGGSVADISGSPAQFYIDSELENVKELVNQLKGNEKETLTRFCKVIRESWDGTGAFKSPQKFNYTTSANLTLKNYLAGYFGKFPKAPETAQFYNKDASTLKSVYTYNNDILYHNPKSLKDVATTLGGPNTNNLFNNNLLGDGNDIIVYASPKDGNPVQAAQSLISEKLADTATFDPSMGDPKVPITGTTSSAFYQMFRATDLIKTDDKNKSVFIDYYNLLGNPDANGIYTSVYFTPQQMFVQHSKSGGAQGSAPKPNDFIFRLLDGKTMKNASSYVIDLDNTLTRSYLYFFCGAILDPNKTYLSLTDSEVKKKKVQDAQTASAFGGGGAFTDIATTEVTGPQPYTYDQAEINAVYTQFHHICQAWIALANINDLEGNGSLPAGTNSRSMNLRTALENAYRSTDKNSFFYLNFQFPLANQVTAGIDIKDAIINTDSLLENNSQTSTLNMMQNICTTNNFLLQPIPGGITDDLRDIFLPTNGLDYGAGKNALSIIWAPTPENRLLKNNSNESIYPDDTFFDQLNKIDQPILGLRYGDPNNVIVKSIKAGTDDNKVTSESIQATSDIANPQNQNKRKSFDCSMLAVMQGRSYKISLDLIGNAQLYPTQLIAVEGLPIFTGLYWITEVQHKITPNNMETTIDAVKMKYGGGENFAAVMPITRTSLKSYDGGGSVGGGGGTENLGFGGDLNYTFLQKIKNKKITKTDDINPIIKEFTKNKYNDFATWFNAELAGNKKPLCNAKINAANFKSVWDFLIPIVWPDYGTSGCNFLEFVALNAIIYEETGGSYQSKHEGMNSLSNAEHPGIAYAFDAYALPATNGKDARSKASYNKAPNKTAGELFNNPNYIDAFKGLKFGTDPKVAKSNDAAWKGTTFPKSLFANVQDAATTSSTFISEADFYKFAGRGFIQSTWRSQYEKFVEFILTYIGTDSIVRKYQGNWKASPYNGNKEVILTKSSNADWDDLFTSGAIQGFAIYTHAKSSKYQYMAPLDKPKEELIRAIEKEAKKVNAGDDYQKVHRTRVYTILDTLYPEGAVAPSVPFNSNATTSLAPPNEEGQRNADNTCTSVKRGNSFIWIHTGKEKQFFKREVRSITLHFTAGYGRNAVDTVDHVGSCGGPFKTGGIHYAIDWQGKTAAGIPEDIYSVHGNSWNDHGIGIEMCNLGKMEPRPDKGNGDNGNPIFYSPAGGRFHYDGQKFMGSIMPPNVNLGFNWLGYQYYQEYTDAQIVALEKLIRELFTRYPKIQQAIQGQNLWSFTFRAVDGKPAPGSTPRVPKYGKGNSANYGIFTHWSSNGGTHTDSAPTPKLVAMLKRLGMNEG